MPSPEEEGCHRIVHRFVDVDGKRFPSHFSEQIIRDIPKLQVKDSDVLICGYLRSGTNWMFEMLNMLLKNSTETIPMWKGEMMLEYTYYEDLHKAAAPRVFNTHLLYEELPNSVRDKGIKIVYVVRDPRDVVVSYFNMYADLHVYKGNLQHFLELFNNGEVCWGSWFKHVNSWEPIINRQRNMLAVYFEETKQDPMKTAKRLSEFLQVECTEALLKEIAEKWGFNRMIKDKKEYSLMVNNKNIMYRKGVVGDWKNWFTVTRSEAFDKMLEEKVGNNKLVQRYLRTQRVQTE